MLAAVSPSLLMLLGFFRLWGGLVPPDVQRGEYRDHGFDLAAVSMVFVLTGVYGLFFSTTFYAEIRRRWSQNRAMCLRFLLGGIILGIFVGVYPHTSYLEPHRSSGFWQLGRFVPCILDRSPVIALFALAGSLIFVAVLLAVSSRDRWVFAVAFLLFAVVQCANSDLFQRYYEPFVLMFLVLATSRVPDRDTGGSRPWMLAASGPLLLGLIQAAITAWLVTTPLKP
jgi:hypothetical protein